jgi:hypothetical protein
VSHAVVAKIYDLADTELVDISSIALERTLKVRANQGDSFVIQARAGHSQFTDIAGDGYPNLRRGNRKLLVWEDGDIIFHGRIFTVERVGDGTANMVTMTAFQPWMELGYDADDRAGRPVRDATGNFINPSFAGTGTGGPDVISGPDLIRQILTNSQGTDDEGGTHPGEGQLPIDLNSGTFDVDVPPAVDLSVIDSMDWPVLCGDFIQQLIDSNVVDMRMVPCEPGAGLNLDGDPDPYIMAVLSAESSMGTDRSATVHLDYFTGSKNASAYRHVEDFATINNKLYDYLGPRVSQTRWKGNITPGSPGTTVDPSVSRALYGGPNGGQFMQIRVFDSVGSANSSRPLYVALWNAEQGLRVEPRHMLFITPSPDAKALFEPPADYGIFDLVSVNVPSDAGLVLAEAQRVYGYDRTWDRQGVARVSELVTSADAE